MKLKQELREWEQAAKEVWQEEKRKLRDNPLLWIPIIVAFVFVFLAGVAHAQTIACQNIGQFTYCNDGQKNVTVQHLGNFDYYSGAITGNAQRVGNFTYYNLQPQKSVTGQDLGNLDYYSGAITGNAQRVGNFTYYNLQPQQNVTVQHLGNFDYYSGTISGNTQRVGNFTYYNLQPQTPPPVYSYPPLPADPLHLQVAPANSYPVNPYAVNPYPLSPPPELDDVDPEAEPEL
jgi:hypothetical protein